MKFFDCNAWIKRLLSFPLLETLTFIQTYFPSKFISRESFSLLKSPEMEASEENLFLILNDNFNWINKHGDEFLLKMKAFYSALPDESQMKAQVMKQLQSIELIPNIEKEFRITKTHQTITSYFMSQVFNGHQPSIVYYVDDIIPTYNSFMNEHGLLDESTIENIHKLELNDEQKFKMELFLRSARLNFISDQAHKHVLNSIIRYVHDIYFRNVAKSQRERQVKARAADEDLHDEEIHDIDDHAKNVQAKIKSISDEASKPSSNLNKTIPDEEVDVPNINSSSNDVQKETSKPEIKYVKNPYEQPSNDYMNEEEFKCFIETFISQHIYFFDYVMLLEMIGDGLKMDLFNSIEELDMKIFKYVYDFIYLDDKTSKKNKRLLDMLKREEIIEILHLIKIPFHMEDHE